MDDDASMDPMLTMLFDFNKNRSWAENLQIVMQIGLTMAGCILFCFFIGYYLDKWLHTKGIFIALFTILGVTGGGIVSYRQIMEVTAPRKKSKEEPTKEEPKG